MYFPCTFYLFQFLISKLEKVPRNTSASSVSNALPNLYACLPRPSPTDRILIISFVRKPGLNNIFNTLRKLFWYVFVNALLLYMFWRFIHRVIEKSDDLKSQERIPTPKKQTDQTSKLNKTILIKVEYIMWYLKCVHIKVYIYLNNKRKTKH